MWLPFSLWFLLRTDRHRATNVEVSIRAAACGWLGVVRSCPLELRFLKGLPDPSQDKRQLPPPSRDSGWGCPIASLRIGRGEAWAATDVPSFCSGGADSPSGWQVLLGYTVRRHRNVAETGSAVQEDGLFSNLPQRHPQLAVNTGSQTPLTSYGCGSGCDPNLHCSGQSSVPGPYPAQAGATRSLHRTRAHLCPYPEVGASPPMGSLAGAEPRMLCGPNRGPAPSLPQPRNCP